jgi:hypothetical protein
MSAYGFLQDHSIGGQYYPAGTVASTADVGGTLPTGWPPSNAVDPLDTPAVNAFYALGPQPMPVLVRQQWSTQGVSPPVTYWRRVVGSSNKWQLTGLGAALPPIAI